MFSDEQSDRKIRRLINQLSANEADVNERRRHCSYIRVLRRGLSGSLSCCRSIAASAAAAAVDKSLTHPQGTRGAAASS